MVNSLKDDKMNYSNDQMNIFLNALFLFSKYGYENVAIGTISKTAKVKTSALFYLGGKSGLLSDCYKYFLVHRYDTRLTPEQYKDIIKNGSKEDVINILLYTFPSPVLENMFHCLTIIMARLYIDDKAKEIYINDINQSMEYMKTFFETGIKIKRFKPFDIQSISTLCVSLRLFGLQTGIINQENFEKSHNTEINVFNEIKKMIPFNY